MGRGEMSKQMKDGIVDLKDWMAQLVSGKNERMP
jgi:hypothetical protein